MTLSREEHARRRAAPGERRGLAADLRAELRAQREASTRLRLPSPRFRDDLDGFCRDVLGIDLADLPPVERAACSAIWLACTFPDAGPRLVALAARSGRCVECKRADPAGEHIPAPCPHSALVAPELLDALGSTSTSRRPRSRRT